MVKNIPTIERSTKIRFGKHANDNQAENSIVFNASNEAISASTPGAVYMTPLRQASVGGATFVGYDATTKEVVDTNVLTSLLGGISLDEASKQGNVVTNTSPHFAHTVTAFTTRYGSNVGIANTSPIHALDVGENLSITRHGNVSTTGKITAGQFYGDGGALSNIATTLNEVILLGNTASSKTVEFNYASGPSLITANTVGISNANPIHTLDVGSNLYAEDTAVDVLNVTGNVNVSNYVKTTNVVASNISLTSITQGDLLVGPSSGTVLEKLAAYTGPSSLSGPAAMSSNSSGGNTASSSGPSAIQANAWKAFDGSDSTSFICREFDYQHFGTYAYWGGTTLGGVNGEWVKIQLASAITPTSVFVKSQPDGTDSAGRPQQWRILASNDDATWTQLHSSTTVVDDSSGTTESFTNTTAYTYFAFIVTNINTNNGKWNLSHLLFNYTGSGPTEKFLKSSAAGVSWDDTISGDGSGLEALNANNVSTGTLAIARGGTGVTTGISVLDPANLSSQVLLAKGGTGLTSISENDLLLGPASGTALTKLAAYVQTAGSTVPAAMSANSSGGNTASASDSSSNAYKAFDGSDSTNYASLDPPTYSSFGSFGHTGSNSLGGVSGEWLKIQLSSAITPISVFLKARPENVSGTARPNSWRILGSNDDSMWTQLHSSTTLVDDTNGTTESFTNTTAYSYLAIVVTNINNPGMGSARWTLSRLSFTSSPSGPTEKFLKSSSAGISWDEVSSSLQTITDGGASTTNEVSFTNGVTSLTASGNVVVTGNVTASNIISTSLTSGKIPYTDANKELIDSKVSFNTTTNVTSVASNLVVTGNLTVQGGTIYQDTDVHTITDPIIELGNANAIDTIDMGIIMTRPTANVAAGYRGDEKEYTIAYTLSDPDGSHIVPTNATSDGYITANVWGNVVAGNVTTTGKMTADSINVTGSVTGATLVGDGSAITNLDLGDATNTGQVAIARGGTGVATGLTVLDPANLSSQVLLAKGGTGLTTVAENDLLLGPASGNALSTLSAYTQSTSSSPAVMSSNSSGGNTASSGNSSADTWKVFDGSDSTSYQSSTFAYQASGVYGGLAFNSLGGVSGEWVKIQLASAIAPTSVFIKGPAPAGNDNLPASWRILGSNDDTNWTQLHSSTTQVTSSGITESFTNTTAYTYLGIVVTNVIPGSGFHFRLSRLSFNYLSGPTEKFLKSSSTGISWDSVSSTLQAITDGGATTTQTVAFNNTTTGLTSAGDIDIAATKQIDYAGDVLIKSSAGAVASFKVDNAIKLDPSYASSSHNVLSINTTTGEIYDSGGQGGSSFNNIREEGANVSIGPTASTNLTVNTFGSNVLSVSGNVSADNITIGSLHVSASPFNFDDVVSASAGANVTSNVITIGGLVTSGNVEAGNVIVTGNTTSQNIKLTNTDISAAISSGTITIDAREKSYGTAPLVTSTTDVSNLVFSNLISGSQIVVPILASGGNIKISKELTNVNFYAMTTDVSVSQDKHALMTLSNVSGNIYMNALAFA